MDLEQVTKSSLGIFSNPKLIVTAFGNFCLLVACIFTFMLGGIFFKYITGDGIKLPDMDINSASGSGLGSRAGSIKQFAVINKRNIFGKYETQKVTQTTTPKAAPPPPKLNIRLVGTNTASSKSKFAIIENKKKRDQDVFRIDEEIFSTGAKLKEVLVNSIKVSYHGKLQTITLEDGISGKSSRGGSSSSKNASFQADSSGSDFSVDEDELSKALSNLPRLLSQARAVPFFRNGKSIGMRLFAIRRGSMYEKVGLKNGDILLSVNNNSVGDPTKAIKLFEELKSERSIQVVVERGGKQKEMNYTID